MIKLLSRLHFSKHVDKEMKCLMTMYVKFM